MAIRDNINLLGMKVRDRVTGLEGIVTSVCFDLYGCTQAIVHPGLDKDGKVKDSGWYDISRLTILATKPVMARPDFDAAPVATSPKGPAEKPLR